MRAAWIRILPVLFAALLGAGAGQSAVAADWSVAQMSGKVAITVGKAQPVSLTKGEVLPAGGILTTGPASRALLVRNAETMVVGANAAIAIPPGSNNGGQYTTILENAGVVEFTVEKQNVQHFAVETPYLAAVVKGTQFSVDVSSTGATVKVTRGIVEVTALATGYVMTLQVGQSAIVHADGTMLVAGAGPNPTVYQGTPRSPMVGPTYDTTGGFGILGQTTASLNVGPVSVDASLGGGGLSLGALVGRSIGLGASVGDGGASVNAAIGDGINVDAGLDSGGASLAASVGHAVDVDASVGGGGIAAGASVAGIDAGVSVGGGGGIQVDAGPASVGIGGGHGIDIDLGPIHLGLGR